jgi:hypothetical protein
MVRPSQTSGGMKDAAPLNGDGVEEFSFALAASLPSLHALLRVVGRGEDRLD